MDEFYADVAAAELQPLWMTAGLLTSTPRPKAVPHRWDGTRVRELAERAGELVPIDRGGDRRVLALVNPGLGGAPWATPTLWAAIQYLQPGESAPAHRHSAAAIRFVIEGSGVSTTVDGRECPMASGDLVLTPAWSWHEHTSSSEHPMVWLDGLDLPLVHALDAMFHELPAEARKMALEPDQSAQLMFGGRRPEPLTPGSGSAPQMLVYRWAETDQALDRLLDSRSGAATVAFVEPVAGGSVLPTLGCLAHRLPAGARTEMVQRSASRVFYVISGEGASRIGDREFGWFEGDWMVAPSWAPVSHTAAVRSDLFELTDAPVMQALGLYQEASGSSRVGTVEVPPSL